MCCNDNNPNITSQVGDACDDVTPTPWAETIQGTAVVAAAIPPTTTCAMVNTSSDDAEEQEST